jgi:hypothetical protein
LADLMLEAEIMEQSQLKAIARQEIIRKFEAWLETSSTPEERALLLADQLGGGHDAGE